MFNRLFSGIHLLIVSVIIAGVALFIFIFTPTGTAEPPAEKATQIYWQNICPFPVFMIPRNCGLGQIRAGFTGEAKLLRSLNNITNPTFIVNHFGEYST